jgi:hypothetical protein
MGNTVYWVTASPRAFRDDIDWRFCAESSTFRRRTFFGVTSMHSSSLMN